MKKSLKVVVSVVVILAVLVSVALIYYFGAGYPYFHKVSTAECAIPGLREGFTPQGMSYDEESNSIIMCGYMKNSKQASIKRQKIWQSRKFGIANIYFLE